MKETRGCVEVGDEMGYFDGKDVIAEIRRIEGMLFGYMRHVREKNVL